MSKTVTVALAADAGYARPLTVAAHSVIATLDPDLRLRLCILDMGISADDRALMMETFRKPQIETVWIDTLRDRVSEFPNTWPAITRAGYARIFAPEVLSDIDRVLYLDCDTLAVKSVADLYFADMNGAWAMGCPDVQTPFVCHFVPNWFEIGRKADEPSFNSGVLLMDLAAWRRERLTEALVQYLTDGRHLRGQDQEAINAVLGHRIGQLDPRWNQQAEIFWGTVDAHYDKFLPYSQETVELIRNDPWIIHYCNAVKPWHYNCPHPALGRWFAALDQTAYRGWRPDRPSAAQRIIKAAGHKALQTTRAIVNRL